jgi:hypothetical protein
VKINCLIMSMTMVAIASVCATAEARKPNAHKQGVPVGVSPLVPFFIKDFPTCNGDIVKLGAGGNKMTLGPIHLLRNSRLIQEVDLDAWRTDCAVPVKTPVGNVVDCKYVEVIGDSSVLITEIEYGGGNKARSLWMTTNANPPVTFVWGAPLTAKSIVGRANLAEWMESPSVKIGERTYDIFVYFVRDDVKDIWTIEKNYRIELFDTSESSTCLNNEPSGTGIVTDPLVPMSAPVGPADIKETDVGEGKEKHP